MALKIQYFRTTEELVFPVKSAQDAEEIMVLGIVLSKGDDLDRGDAPILVCQPQVSQADLGRPGLHRGQGLRRAAQVQASYVIADVVAFSCKPAEEFSVSLNLLTSCPSSSTSSPSP